MPSTVDKKGDHEPTKYFEDEGKLTKTEELTEQKISTPEKLDDHDLENLCSKFLMNKIYYKMAKKKQRDQAIEIAAYIIITKGKDIQKKLNHNDLEIRKIAEKTKSQDQRFDNNPILTEKGSKSDIPKISGGTLSEVIAKIAEMLAGKSRESFKKGANNFSAMIEVLATPEVGPKFDDAIKNLAKDPVLVIDIKNILRETPSAEIFDNAVERNFSDTEKTELRQIKIDDLKARREENESSINKQLSSVR